MKCMEKVQRSQAFLRKRKMMLVLPFIVIPFITLAFWALGGGKGNAAATLSKNKGLNLNLPDAALKDDKETNKLGFYELMEKDSTKMEEWMRNDPYYKLKEDSLEFPSADLEQITQSTATKYNQRLNISPYASTTINPEQKLLQKLALLEKQLNKPVNDTVPKNTNTDYNSGNDFSGDVSKLEYMMQQANNTTGTDPEITQLNTTLEKILDIQHPQRFREKLNESEIKNKGKVFTVTKQSHHPGISLLDTQKNQAQGEIGFYGIDKPLSVFEQNAIEAVVHETQTLVNGSVIKIRLTNDVYVNGTLIPKGSFVFGFVSLNDERLTVEINSIRTNQSIFPVKLQVYDMDGLAGIYIPGAITRDVAKQSADNSLQLMELSSIDPSFKAQATAAGISTVKSLLSRKVKLIKVMVKAGYRVLLKDKDTNE